MSDAGEARPLRIAISGAHGTGKSTLLAPAPCLFDRCPMDLLAYLSASAGPQGYDASPWMAPMRHAMRALDLVVYVPVEIPDRLRDVALEHRGLRRRVDETLRTC